VYNRLAGYGGPFNTFPLAYWSKPVSFLGFCYMLLQPHCVFPQFIICYFLLWLFLLLLLLSFYIQPVLILVPAIKSLFLFGLGSFPHSHSCSSQPNSHALYSYLPIPIISFSFQPASFPSQVEQLQFYYQAMRKFQSHFQTQEVSSTYYIYDKPPEVRT